ncbi:MAG: HAMP domain-containing histidine kinase [FCB group bacterium]|nr:HAMP domain-containing histidine kinase [FCB group bacterium]
MRLHSKPFQIKLGLFVLGIVVILAVVWSNWLLIEEIRKDARKQVEFLAKAYSDAINKSEGNDIRYVMDYLLPSINFPIIITNPDEIYAYKNINVEAEEGSPQFQEELKRIEARMDEAFDPLPVIWNEQQISEIHFGDPEIVGQIQWLPYFEVGGVLIFVLFGFLGFQLIRKSERNFIWAGMARETAHQLGTPISSLLGWLKLLEDGDEDLPALIAGMDQDIHRLNEISDRFHKIGSKPQFKKVNLMTIAASVCDYMQSRVSSRSGVKIETSGAAVEIRAEETLISWAIENLIKNAIDATHRRGGKIEITIQELPGQAILEIRDNGQGISRSLRRNIFRPGFSTKTRGWGLGLSLTRRIVEEIHSGSVRLVRSKPGETIFRITLKK